MARIAIGIAVLIGMLVSIGMCASRGAQPAGMTTSACAAKGEAYFKSTGSWPTLDDGRQASVVAWQRCEREPLAFGS